MHISSTLIYIKTERPTTRPGSYIAVVCFVVSLILFVLNPIHLFLPIYEMRFTFTLNSFTISFSLLSTTIM